MKRFFIIIAAVALSIACVAEDRPVTMSQLPAAAQEFINANYPGEKISFATMDDDLIRPDYTVMLSNGVKIQFDNDGRLESIEARNGVPESLIPVQIKDFVTMNYPDALIVEYEIGRRDYEVTLSNRLELRFNSSFNLVEMDD